MSMSLDSQPPESGVCAEWARAEAQRRENAARMEGVDSVDEMMATRALPAPTEEDE